MSTSKTFLVVGYSLGATVTLELVASLEQDGYVGKVILLDGGPELQKGLVTNIFSTENEAQYQASVLSTLMTLYLDRELNAQDKVILSFRLY